MKGAQFSGLRLRTVRHFQQLTQTELANLIAVSPASICRYENAHVISISEEVVQAMCEVLDVQKCYFYRPPLPQLTADDVDYRSLSRVSKKVRDRFMAFGSYALEWIQHLRRDIRFPPLNVPSLSATTDDDIEQAADECRRHWKLGFGPIHNVMRVLENAGIIIATIATSDRNVDAFGICTKDYGIVVLNTAKGSTSRAIQDCAHELGHAVLHRDAEEATKIKESQAKRFAGAFLLPRSTFPREFWSTYKSGLYESQLIELKRRWRVSIQSIVFRAHQLDIIGAAEFRRFMKKASIRGWRSGTPEPAEPEPLKPELLARAFTRYQQTTRETREETADRLGWGDTIFDAVTGTSSGMAASKVERSHVNLLSRYPSTQQPPA